MELEPNKTSIMDHNTPKSAVLKTHLWSVYKELCPSLSYSVNGTSILPGSKPATCKFTSRIPSQILSWAPYQCTSLGQQFSSFLVSESIDTQKLMRTPKDQRTSVYVDYIYSYLNF